jgi:hypothetical protein
MIDATGDRLGVPGRDRPVTRAFHYPRRSPMLIKLTTQITGTRDGVDWPAVGETIDVPDSEAADMIAAGLAVEVEAPKTTKKG